MPYKNPEAHRKERQKYGKEYRRAHREEIAKRGAKHYAAHRIEIAKQRAEPERRKAKLKYNTEYYKVHCKDIAKQHLSYIETHRKEIAKYLKEHSKEISEHAAKYMKEYRPTHRAEQAWHDMHKRCNNPVGRSAAYAGIKVCKRWSGDRGKENFVSDMGQPPAGTTLSRYADTGDYTPSNCAWHTWKQQAAEHRKKLTMNAKTIAPSAQAEVRVGFATCSSPAIQGGF